jgi:hypothetical protein
VRVAKVGADVALGPTRTIRAGDYTLVQHFGPSLGQLRQFRELVRARAIAAGAPPGLKLSFRVSKCYGAARGPVLQIDAAW